MDKFLKHAFVSYRSHIIMLLMYIVFTAVAYSFLRQNAIENFTNFGNETAQFYKIEEEKSFAFYKNLLTHLASILEGTNTNDAVNIQDVLTFLTNSSDTIQFEPYAIINEKIITGKKRNEKDIKSEDFNWYYRIKNVQDGFVVSDVYIDNFTHEPTITIAKFMENSKNMVAMDISVKNYIPPIKNALLPPKSNYYLFGVSGNLFYYDDDLGLSKEGIAKNAKILYDIVLKADKTTIENLSYFDANGMKKIVFFDRTKDNLLTIVTIPYEYLVSRIDRLLCAAIAFIAVLSLFTLVNIVTTYFAHRKQSMLADTLTFLGNIYYAIMLVDTEKEEYIVVKKPQRLADVLKNHNPYIQLLEVIQKKMEKPVAESFMKAFSMENIHRISQEGVKEFGGEFKTLIEDQPTWVSVRIFLDHIENNHSAIICCKVVTREKEQEVRQHELLKSAVENAKKSEKSRNDFFARMSHDMRTPLNGIIGYTELGMNHAFTIEETKDYLRKIKLSSHQLLELINYILEISRLENGTVDEIKTKVNLRETIEHSLQPFYSLALTEIRRFSVHYDLKNDFVYAPAFKLVQILNNLLSNAFKYSRKGDSITVTVKQLFGSTNEFKQTKYLFVVEDTGIGMSKDFLEKIFIPYQRETMFASKDIIGTGLGMSIVQSIVTGLNGEINISSELDVGTKISIVIPFDIVEEEDVPVIEEKKETKDLDLIGLHVLLVEDNQINMEIANKLLTFKGMIVDKAYNGEEAVSRFFDSKKDEYDIILMDLQMPVMNGLEAVEVIRSSKHPNAKDVPIIAVSANTFAEDIAKSLQVGMNDHISKPLDVATLYYTIYNHTRGKRK